MQARQAGLDFAQDALGRAHRGDPVLDGSGGPAGNARLTAWTGLVLLVLFAVELVTLLDVRGLVSWHIIVGVLLVPPALLKTATTGWRIARYYTGHRPYRQAGPPTLVLRLVGPIVVLSTLALLGTGIALILVTPSTAREDVLYGLSLLNLHKAAFVIWAGATAVHVLGRLLLALRLTVARTSTAAVPGRYRRVAVLGLTAVVAIGAGILAASLIGPWQADQPFDRGDHHFSKLR
jgi:hypothetical protein